MKRIVVLALIALAVVSASAQVKYKPVDAAAISKILGHYKNSLKAENDGIRQSTLYQLARIKADYPWANLAGIMDDVKRVSKKDKSETVRIQANLVLAYLKDDSLSKKVQPEVPDEYAGFYSRIQAELFGPTEQVAE
jgi:hypothetical protein